MSMPDSEMATTALTIAGALAAASPGEKSDARRMGPEGSPLFWRLAARLKIPQRQERAWLLFTRLVALMTPASRDKTIHDNARPLGAALAQASLSELRFARLLATRGPAREDALERAVRMMARSSSGPGGLDVVDLARTILWPDDTARIARNYYRVTLEDSHHD